MSEHIDAGMCRECFTVFEASRHDCPFCHAPSKYRNRLDRRSKKRGKAKSSTATIILSPNDENEAFVAKAVELGFYEWVNE